MRFLSSLANRHQAKHGRHRNRQSKRRVLLESLEDRRLLAAYVVIGIVESLIALMNKARAGIDKASGRSA